MSEPDSEAEVPTTDQRLALLKEIQTYEDSGREVERVVNGSGQLVGYHVVPIQHQLEEGESVTTSLITD